MVANTPTERDPTSMHSATAQTATRPRPAAPPRADQTVPYAGMDMAEFPGRDFLTYLHDATNIRWTGAYLDSPRPFPGQAPVPPHHAHQVQGHNMLGGTPGHPAGSWMAGAAQARAIGFGVLPIYWGQQDDANNQGPWDLRAVAGRHNGADAVAKAAAMALDPHAVIYLDYENPHLGADGIAYCTAWFAAIAEAGYRPGIYAHGAAALRLRQEWPDLAVWVVNPWVHATDWVSGTHRQRGAFVVPRVGDRVQVQARDPGPSGVGQDLDGLAWQMWFSSSYPWPATLTFPAPTPPLAFPLHLPDGTLAIDAGGRAHFPLDVSSSSVADPAFPERANAPGLVRRGRLSGAVVDATTLGLFAVRRGALVAMTWTSAKPGAGARVALPDPVVAFNPWSPHAALNRGPAGDLAVVVRSAVEGTSDDAWQLGAYRRRGTRWTYDANINGAIGVEPLFGVGLVSRRADTVEAFFLANDGTHRLYVTACTDAATQTDDQAWSTPRVVNGPAGGMLPSLVGGIGLVSRAAGTIDVFVVARATSADPWRLYWNSSSILGAWPPFGVPGDPAVSVHPSSQVAAVSRGPELVDVFAIAKRDGDTDWRLYRWWWRPADQWGAAPDYHTRPIGGASVAPQPVSKLAAVSHGLGHVDVFVVGAADGLLYTTSYDDATGTWTDFRRVGANAVKVGSVDGAYSRAAGAIDVVVTGRDGNVYVSSRDGTKPAYTDLTRVTPFDLA
jgi:Domain of unknown function (DUF1906)